MKRASQPSRTRVIGLLALAWLTSLRFAQTTDKTNSQWALSSLIPTIKSHGIDACSQLLSRRAPARLQPRITSVSC